MFNSTGINSIKLLPFIETPLDHYLDISRSNARPNIKHAAMVKLDTVSTYTADGLLRTTQQQRWHLLYWLIFEVHLAHDAGLRIQARLNEYEAIWDVWGSSSTAGRWERYDDARGVISRARHIVEMQLPRQS
ncbi:hypothetical protein E8E11_001939 [Didymella keratinophila]|nr:hypothetical protein E8E11_001939 [Didymella keratinophila]